MSGTLALMSRQVALGVLARAPSTALAQRMQALGELPSYRWLRKPETGLLMLRARIGGNGAPFNLGETTVTRCTLRLEDGTVGVGTVRGREARQAEHIALCDALLQRADSAQQVQGQVLDVLAKDEEQRRAQRAAEVAASKVDFFTLVRGDD